LSEIPPTEDTPVPPVPPLPPGVSTITIEDEMKSSYLDYAMSVIVSRALPDVRDGLKPVHRRILFSMKEQGYDWNRTFRKSARVVGDVMGKYHPHGDTAIYDAMVRMAQTFSMRLPLVDGQGNFGSMDGDPPAAMRYTEARLAKAAHELLEDIDKETVDFQENYDNTSREPMVFPGKLRQHIARTHGASGQVSEPAGQRRRRHRRRYGHQYSAPQSWRSDRRLLPFAGRSGNLRGSAHGMRSRPRFPDRRHHLRRHRDALGVRNRARFRDHARADRDRTSGPRP
jgi:hypothetical protein